MAERGLSVDHTTIWRWVQRYALEVHQRLRGNLKPKSSTWHIDETLIRIAGRWLYLFRAADGHGQTPWRIQTTTRRASWGGMVSAVTRPRSPNCKARV